MKFLQTPCIFCKKGVLQAQHSRRGWYYRCNHCKQTINKRPKKLTA